MCTEPKPAAVGDQELSYCRVIFGVFFNNRAKWKKQWEEKGGGNKKYNPIKNPTFVNTVQPPR